MPEARAWVLDRKVTDDLVGAGTDPRDPGLADELPPDRLAEFLIGGVAYQDVPEEVDGAFLSLFSATWTPPGSSSDRCPTRSSCATTRRGSSAGVTLNPMYWPARRQETLLTTAVYKFHPAFADEKYDVWLGDPDGRPPTTGWPPSRAAT